MEATMSDEGAEFSLLERWRAGHREAADELVRRHSASVASFLRTKAAPEDHEDLKQEIWEALLRNKTLKDGSVRAYLLAIARNVVCAYHKKRNRRTVDPLSTSMADLDAPLSQQISLRLGSQKLLLALQRMPLDDQTLLELRYFEEMSTRDLAVVFAVPEGTIKSRLFSARKRLEQLLALHSPLPNA